ncbi:hypothetical protein D3C87_377410 [compost metagenome]
MNSLTRFLWLYVFVGIAALTGCKEPDVSVGSLGKLLSAPSLKSQSPFDQDFDIQNYALFKGTCDHRITELWVKFNSSSASVSAHWKMPPESPNLTDTALSNVVNDLDCQDGTFEFYLTRQDILSLWGFDASDNGPHIDNIYLKGTTPLGDTRILTLTNDGGTTPQLPYKIHIEKQNLPLASAASGTCQPFLVSLTDLSNVTARASQPVPFSIGGRLAGAGTSDTPQTLYLSSSECVAGTNGNATRSIATGDSQLQVHILVPSLPNAEYEFQVSSPDISGTNSSVVTIRDANSNYGWMASTSGGALSASITHWECSPVSIKRFTYNGVADLNGPAFSISVNSPAPLLRFYSDAACTNATSAFSFASKASTSTLYVRYETTTVQSSFITSLNLTPSSADYDTPASMSVAVNTSAPLPAASLTLSGTTSATRGACSIFYAIRVDGNGQQTAPNLAQVVNLAISLPSGAAFYQTTDCSNTPVTAVTIPAGQSSVAFAVKTNAALTTSSTLNISATSPGLPTSTFPYSVMLVPTAIEVAGLNNITITQSCHAFQIAMKDDVGIISANASTNLRLKFTKVVGMNFSAFNLGLYDNEDCDSGQGKYDLDDFADVWSSQAITSVSGSYPLWMQTFPNSPVTAIDLAIEVQGISQTFRLNIQGGNP